MKTQKITQANIDRLKHLGWHSSKPIAVVKLFNEATQENYYVTEYQARDHSVTVFVDSPNCSSLKNINIDTIENDKDISRDLMFKETSLHELSLIDYSGWEVMMKELYDKYVEKKDPEPEENNVELPTDQELEEFNKQTPDFDIDI